MSDLFKSNSLKNIALLSGGTIIGQAIPILLQPIFRRLFSVDEFGTYALYSSIFGIIGVISALRYEMAIIQPKHDNEAANLLFVSLAFNLLISLALFILILIFKSYFASQLSFPEKYSYWLYFGPVTILLFGFFRSLNFWFIRMKAFKISAYNKIYRRGAESISLISFGMSHANIGLVISEILGNLVNVASGVYYLIKENFSFNRVTLPRMRCVARKYIKYPKFNTIPSLLDIASLQLPVLIINHHYSKYDVAQFDLSRLILSVSLVLIGTSISQVIQQKVTEDRNNGFSIREELKSLVLLLVAASILQIIIIVLFGPQIFKLFFGEQWAMAGQFAQILIFGFVCKFIVSPLSIIFISLDRIFIYSLWQYSYFIGILSLFFIDGLSLKLFLYIYVIIEVIFYIICLFMLNYAINSYEKSLNLEKHK